MGEAEFKPTKDQRTLVMVMVGMGVLQETIAQMVGDGISQNTLRKYFAHELKNGREHFVASIKGQLAKAAQNGSVRAQTYILDRLGGPEWAPRQRLGDVEVPRPLEGGGDTRVTIFLPDNRRSE